MTHYQDLEPWERWGLLAVGWLEVDHPYPQGPVEEAFFTRLIELLVKPWDPFVSAGFHRCSLCRFSGGPGGMRFHERSIEMGQKNLFVPWNGKVFIAPSLIAHSIDSHHYCPPKEFQQAVLECPRMSSAAYLKHMKQAGLLNRGQILEGAVQVLPDDST